MLKMAIYEYKTVHYRTESDIKKAGRLTLDGWKAINVSNDYVQLEREKWN